MLRAEDLVVFNDTRVFPARVYGRGGGIGKGESQKPHRELSFTGRIEVLLTRQISREPNEWECLVRPGRKVGVGEQLFFGENGELGAVVIGRGEFGERRIRFE